MFYLNYKDYLTKWDEIAGIFSKNAVLKGSFDKYAADKKSKRGTAEVDAAFLEEIAGWREILARNIALRNPDLSTKDLNYAVQAIVNRIVFLRICEDRGIERLMKLQDLLNGERVYPRLCEIFRRADERYNSGIFHFEKEPGRESPDTLTLSLNIDDKPLKEIIKRLYYPDSPYEFSVLPAEILGQVYEQFLGKVIRLTEGHRAVVEDKPEVKKAGGVKYTPVYIVENIVGNTLGHILKGKTPLEVVLITVLDPACGSGSFLIVAYQYLLDWHRDWYVQNLVPLLQSGLKPSSPEIRRLIPGVETGKKGRKKEVELPIFQGRGGEWRLTTAERKRILLKNIYGVDIDRQAVEVTKLSLLLKVLEGENDETISKQLKLFQERALPDLSNNIKCGNSLIGWDILKDNPGIGQEEIDRINPFDWEKEFSDIMQASGFHIIIGNPPYGAFLSLEETEYLLRNFQLQEYQLDTYLLFVEKCILLLKNNGFFGMIIPNTWLLNLQTNKIREFLFNQTEIIDIIHYHYPVFSKVTVDTEITIMKKVNPADAHEVGITIVEKDGHIDRYKLPQSKWRDNVGRPVNILDRPEFASISKKIKGYDVLDNICIITQGCKPFQVGKGRPKQTKKTLEEKPFVSNMSLDNTFRPLLRGSLIQKYQILWNNDYWISFGDWLAEPRYSANYDAPEKIVIRQTGDSLLATLDCRQFIVRDNLYTIVPGGKEINLKYVLGIINSCLLNWFYQKILNPEKGEALAQVKRGHLAQLPIALPNLANLADKTRYDHMVNLVDTMLSLRKQLYEARTPHEQTSLQRQIEATDGQIDALVYELYELTKEEIRLVDGTWSHKIK